MDVKASKLVDDNKIKDNTEKHHHCATVSTSLGEFKTLNILTVVFLLAAFN